MYYYSGFTVLVILVAASYENSYTPCHRCNLQFEYSCHNVQNQYTSSLLPLFTFRHPSPLIPISHPHSFPSPIHLSPAPSVLFSLIPLLLLPFISHQPPQSSSLSFHSSFSHSSSPLSPLLSHSTPPSPIHLSPAPSVLFSLIPLLLLPFISHRPPQSSSLSFHSFFSQWPA